MVRRRQRRPLDDTSGKRVASSPLLPRAQRVVGRGRRMLRQTHWQWTREEPPAPTATGTRIARARNPFGVRDGGEMDSGLATSSRPGMREDGFLPPRQSRSRSAPGLPSGTSMRRLGPLFAARFAAIYLAHPAMTAVKSCPILPSRPAAAGRRAAVPPSRSCRPRCRRS